MDKHKIHVNSLSKKLVINLLDKDKTNNFGVSDTIQFHFEKFLQEAKTNFNKSKYRKVLEDIKDKHQKFLLVKDYYITYELRLKCLRKILERKLNKGNKSKNILDWLIRIDITLEEWFAYISEYFKSSDIQLADQINLQLELLIKNSLYQCYHYALLSKSDKNMSDTIGFLSLGERLIKFIIDITYLPDTLFIIQKIYLFQTSLLIADEDFELAKEYSANCLKYALKELYQRIDTSDGIIQEKMSKKELIHLQKTTTNIVLAFYQRGVCEENRGNLLRAIEDYKQAKWFAVNFLSSSNSDLTKFIQELEIRALNYNNLVNILNNNLKIKQNSLSQHKNYISKLYHNEEERLNRFNGEIKRIESMVFHEFDDNDLLKKKSENLKFVLSTVKTINNLLSNKFRDLVKNINEQDFEIGKLNKDLRDKIQKKINEIKAERIYNENSKRNKQIKAVEKTNKSFDDSIVGIKDISQYNKSNSLNYNIEERTKRHTHSESKLNTITHSGDKIAKYQFSKFISNKKYQAKKDYLSTLEMKESLFQRNLLKSKRNEKINIEDVNYKKINIECELFFNKVITNTKKTFIEKEKNHQQKEIYLEEKKLNNNQESKLTRQVLKSLDYKSLDKLKNIIAINNVRMKEMPSSSKNVKLVNVNETHDVNKEIKEKINLFDNQLALIENNTVHLKKIIEIDSKAKKPKFNRKKKEYLSSSKVNTFIAISKNEDNDYS